MATVGSLVVNIIARTKPFIAGIAKARGGLKGLQASATGATSAMAGLGASIGVLAGAGAIASLIRAQEDLNQAMAKSLSVMGEVSEMMRTDMRQAAIDMARITTKSAAEVAESFFFLASAGLNAEQSLAALPLVAKFSQAGFFDMARATDLLTDAQKALGLASEDAQENLQNMTRVADVLVKANTVANASVEEFSEALTTKAAAAARTLGIEVEEAVAVLSVFADAGLKGSDAGTAFTITMRELTNKAIINADAFEHLGIKVFDASDNLRAIADITKDLENRLDGASARTKTLTLLQLGFNQKSIAGIKLLLDASETMRGRNKEFQNAADITEDVSDNLTDMQKAVAQLDATWQELGENMDKPTEALVGVIGTVNALTGALSNLADKLGVAANGFDLFFASTGPIQALAFLLGFKPSDLLKAGAGEVANEIEFFPNQFADFDGDNESLRARTIREAADERLFELQGKIAGIIEKTLTPQQVLTRQFRELKEVFDTGGISADVLAKRQEQLFQAYKKQDPVAKGLADRMNAVNAVIQANRTPLEIFIDGMDRLNDLAFGGLGLSPEQAAREEERLRKELEGTREVPVTESPAALQRGSIAAFSASLNAQKDATVKEQEKTNVLLKKQNILLKDLSNIDIANIA